MPLTLMIIKKLIPNLYCGRRASILIMSYSAYFCKAMPKLLWEKYLRSHIHDFSYDSWRNRFDQTFIGFINNPSVKKFIL